ncbi:MAG: hypothetical protein E6J89_19170 [Deltaproteobacteria bacterium]|nr:MAG: hypothetical protein E6J89_19170 [Deltaproteobacteria bacterium]
MSKTMTQVKLQDGTLIRHRVTGYEGRIEGTTEIKTCFTAGGELLVKSNSKEIFQYRVVVKGESMRRIAPAEDFEILEGVVEMICAACHSSFRTKPDFPDKPGGRCKCGGWICPSCLACQDAGTEPPCLKQQKRLARKLALQKKARMG